MESATTAGPHPSDQSQEFSFAYDTTGPVISDLQTVDIDGVKTVQFTVTDNTWLAAIDFHDPNSGGWFYRAIASDPQIIDGQRVWSFSIPVADIQAEWNNVGLVGDLPSTLPLYAWDYGLNASDSATTVINEIPMSSISVSPTDVSAVPGQRIQATASYEPADATVTDIVWSSSDDTIATVSEGGLIAGVSEGTAQITAADAAHPEVSATVAVTVAEVAESTGIVLSDSDIAIATSSSTDVSALLSPGLRAKDPVVEWSSSDSSILTIDPSEDTLTATLSATDRNGDATVTAIVDTGDAVYRAEASVRVRQADYDDFVIDDDGTLLGYLGSHTYITIPDGVTAIAEDAFRTRTMQTVHVPSTVTSIGDRAFMDAPNLREVTFEDTEENPSQLTTVGADLVSGDLRLDTVKLPRSVTIVGGPSFCEFNGQNCGDP